MEFEVNINISDQDTGDSSTFYVTKNGAKISYGYFAVCLIAIVLAGWIITLNAIVIHALLFRKVYKDVTDYFVSSLAMADLATGVVLIYVTSYSLLQYQNFWECLFRFGLTYIVSHSSFTHILAIAIDRYVKIMYPLRYFTIFTKKTVIIISASIWIGSAVIGMLPILGWHQEYKSGDNTTVCKFFGVLTNDYFVFNLLANIVSSAGTLFLYLGIIVKAVRQRNQRKAMVGRTQTDHTTTCSHTWKLVKTVAILVVFSNLCWSPAIICISLHVCGHLDGMSIAARGDLITFTVLAIFLNSLFNPVIYAVKIGEVKKRFKQVFCRYKVPILRQPNISNNGNVYTTTRQRCYTEYQ